MLLDIFKNLILNVSFLVLIAQGLTKSKRMQRVFIRTEESGKLLKDELVLALIFGGISILSTYTGVSVKGAIVNTRVIGVMAGGILGGPLVGIMAAVIAGAHRYLYDIGGLTAVACAVSTFTEGLIGAAVSGYVRKHRWKGRDLFLSAFVAESLQMALILLIARPYEDALSLVETIGLPMILLNSCGVVLFISIFTSNLIHNDRESARSVRRVLDITDHCLPYLRKGLGSAENLKKAADMILERSGEDGVIITDRSHVLCGCSRKKGMNLETLTELPEVIKTVMEEKKSCVVDEVPTGNILKQMLRSHTMLIAPLTKEGAVIGSFSLFIRKYKISRNSDIDFVDGLARIFSTQLQLAEINQQKALRQKAEFQALQSQINPHFLFNALNTITAFCREKPDKARELLIVLGTYFRNTLDTQRYMIDIQDEISHVKSYLLLEEARFEDRLTVEFEVPEELHAEVPHFILQPIVENAVKHGAMTQAHGHVRISARREGTEVAVTVEDNGNGMPEELITALENNEMKEGKVGLSNVQKRLKSIYGEDYGLRIKSSAKGTSIQMNIPGGKEI